MRKQLRRMISRFMRRNTLTVLRSMDCALPRWMWPLVLDMGRSATNVFGNSIAAAVVSRWEKALR